MTATPWGEAESLRSRKLPPGPGRSPEAVDLHQRERLLGATVAVVAERGYEATRVEDVLVLAGVSRNAFYRHFSNKRACFVATLQGIADFATPVVVEAFDREPDPWDRKLAAMLDAFAALIVVQPAMARVGWIEVYAAGGDAVEAIERLDRSIEDTVCRALKDSPERAGMPREIVRAAVGGLRKIVHARVREDRAGELPELMPELLAWMLSYETPPERLRRPRRVPPDVVAPISEPQDARERILAAVTELVAENGYPEMAITEIAARAAVSLTTFYAHFDGKEAALLATLADVQQRVFAATAAHFVAAPDWPSAVSASARAFVGFLATDPSLAHFGGVEVWAASPAGLDLRAQGMALFSALLEEGFRQYPDTNPVAAEAIGAAIDALLFTWLRREGAQRLYELAPTGVFVTLAPFLGSERACELANSPPATIGQTTL
jgi:AcrR family transcriptional regulator